VCIVAHLVVASVFLELVMLSSIEADALLKDINQIFNWRVGPKIASVLRLGIDEYFTASDHLVR